MIRATESTRQVVDLVLRRMAISATSRKPPPADIAEFAADRFYIPWERNETKRVPIPLTQHQIAVLRYALQARPDGRPRFTTVLYSTPKKSGKTTVAGLVARWIAETKGPFAEVLCVANDFDQAKNRVFESVSRSIELVPGYHVRRRELPGEWRILDRVITHVPNGSVVKALATDYKGEAGGEPTETVWTELWGYESEAARRFWTELTPVPTRKWSQRWVETYAGFEGESELLQDLYQLGKAGKQINAHELGDLSAFVEAPNWDSLVPCWVNESAGLFMYWDEDVLGRRMPWQHGEEGDRYYREQESILTPSQFRRIHLNKWESGEGDAIPVEWWDACADPVPLVAGDKAPLVVGVDASVSGDCTAVVGVTRHPQHKEHVVQRVCHVWQPGGQDINYDATLSKVVDWLIDNHNVVEIAYDPYQLHYWATRQREKAPGAWYREFAQGGERLVADKGLYDLIRDRRLHHSGDPTLRQHVQNVALKVPKGEENKLRFEKRAASRKIDGAVALSMAAAECLRLNL